MINTNQLTLQLAVLFSLPPYLSRQNLHCLRKQSSQPHSNRIYPILEIHFHIVKLFLQEEQDPDQEKDIESVKGQEALHTDSTMETMTGNAQTPDNPSLLPHPGEDLL